MSQRSLAIDVTRISDGLRETRADSVAVEEPLEIRLGFSTPDGRET